MLYRISIFDLPNLSDEHYGDRDLALFMHTSPSLRRYRDCFIEHYGPDFAYDRLFMTVRRAVRDHFREIYAEPFFELREKIAELIGEAMMNATLATANAMIGTMDRFNEKIEGIIAEVVEDHTEVPLAGDNDHPIAPLRRLYAVYGAVFAELIVPFAPRVADILSRALGSEYVVPWHEPRYELLRAETRKEVRRITESYGPDKATEVLAGMLPPDWGLAPDWDVEALIREVFAEIVGVFFTRCNDDAYLETMVEEMMKPNLDPYVDPWDQYYKDIKSYIPDVTEEQYARSLEKRIWRVHGAHLIEWIAQAESCGHPIDMTWIELCPAENEGTGTEGEGADTGEEAREP
jgi:hypothetical protein